jgi:hypothetical protein
VTDLNLEDAAPLDGEHSHWYYDNRVVRWVKCHVHRVDGAHYVATLVHEDGRDNNVEKIVIPVSGNSENLKTPDQMTDQDKQTIEEVAAEDAKAKFEAQASEYRTNDPNA